MKRVKLWSAITLMLMAIGGTSLSMPRGLPDPSAVRDETDDIKIHTHLVTLTVTVLDRGGQPIAGLNREHFEIYEDKIRQEIEFFSERDDPASIGIVFDLSSSMHPKLEQAREAVELFLEMSHPEDEFFLLTFNDKINQVTDFVPADLLARRLPVLTTSGGTALYDAIYAGVEKLKQGRHKKHVLLVLSDGADNRSRYTFRQVRQLIREGDALLYGIGNPTPSGNCGRVCHQQAMLLLDELVTPTGGRTYFPRSRQDLEDAASEIAVTIRRLYSLGYVPGNRATDGKWRNIQVRLSQTATTTPKVSLRARAGYYADR
jgi:Ca-activated chloride channel family protein